MSNSSMEYGPPDESGQEMPRIHEVCRDILTELIPNKLEKSIIAKQTIDAAIKLAGLNGLLDSSMYLVSDSFVDGVPSYRLRLIPQELRRGISFYDEGEIQAVIINVPISHVEDPVHARGIEMSFATFYVDTPDGTVMHRYVVTPTNVRTYTDHSTLDFYYKKSGLSRELDIVDEPGAQKQIEGSLLKEEEQLYIAGLLYVALDGAYVLGRQSRRDKTMGQP